MILVYMDEKYHNRDNLDDFLIVVVIIPQMDFYFSLCSYWPKNTKKNKSPFEGLLPQQLKNRLNYLYYATSHPFKPKSYTDYLHSNSCAPKSVKHLNVARDYYPQLSQDQINFNDCLNFPKGHPKSCNLGNDKWKAEEEKKQLLSDCIANEKDLKQIVIEDFDQKKLFTNTTNTSNMFSD